MCFYLCFCACVFVFCVERVSLGLGLKFYVMESREEGGRENKTEKQSKFPKQIMFNYRAEPNAFSIS